MIVPSGVLVSDPLVLGRLDQLFGQARDDGRLPSELVRLHDEIRRIRASATALLGEPPDVELAERRAAADERERPRVNVADSWLTVVRTAHALGISQSQVKRIAEQLGGQKVAGRWLVPRAPVEVLAKQKRTRSRA